MDLVAKAKSAVRWAASLTLLTQVVMWAVTIIIIRILSPEDYGLMAMCMVLIGFAMIVNELGLGSALVQKSELSEEEIRAAHGFVIALNIFLYSIFFISAGLIASFFEEPLLEPMIRVIALLFPVLGLEVVPLALLERELNFKRKASVYLLANVSGVLVSLIFALLGAGVWSLIFGNLWAAVAKAVGINVSVRRLILPTMKIAAVKPMLGFGGIVASERVLWYVYSQADVLLIGKVLGKEQLGYYYVALNLASLIYHKTGGLMYEVSLPTFANAQTDIEKVGRFFARATRLVSYLVFPLMFGLAAISPDAVPFLLGEKWIDAVPLVLVLCLSMPARILANLFPPALQGIGQPKQSLLNLAVAVLVMVPAITVAVMYSTQAVALVWLAVYPIVLTIMFSQSHIMLGTKWNKAAVAVMPPLLASIVMFLSVYYLGQYLMTSGLSINARLSLTIVFGAVVYLILSLLGLRRHLSELIDMARR